jgi:hypothetical protein
MIFIHCFNLVLYYNTTLETYIKHVIGHTFNLGSARVITRNTAALIRFVYSSTKGLLLSSRQLEYQLK